MSEIRRLLVKGGTARERALLRAADADGPPSPAGRARALAALGLATGVAGTAAAANVGVLKGAAKTVGLAHKLAGLSLVKWSAVVAVGVATAAAGVTVGRAVRVSPAGTTTAIPVHASAVTNTRPTAEGTIDPAPPKLAATASIAIESAEKGVPSLEPRLHPATPRPRSPESFGGPPPLDSSLNAPTSSMQASALPPASFVRPVDPLGEQLAVLDRARVALAAHDPSACLREIDDFHRRFPAGALTPEATVLEVRARLDAGDRASAAALARRFAEQNPKSPYRDRVLEIVSEP